ncbi:MAG: dihydrolipoamide dehydrogenase, partial [Rhodospirillaceae bacterium]|nr:dihydrolipoamide dehydrogenase [Rhodospirillaceae bacterium]
IVGPHAGELIQPWILAISQKMKIGAMAQMIAPYPTLGEINKRAAGSYYTPSLFSDRTRKIVRLLAKLG